ncbi:MoaD/ThiS family protein [Kocuria indica]|uniref:MoaD/ThiS family protein n=1 Tax=Kocuria marina TaxID=223184 RepID=UPI001EF4BA97|nr:MoaD/ThiS family protein [Kocuria indica]MCG7432353.1 MoaD/ThiS family protein [Kocuria indica]
MRIRYFAAARAAAGTHAEDLDLGAGALSRREAGQRLALHHREPPPGQPLLTHVLARSSFLLDGVACPDPAAQIPPGATLDVLRPFSGG